MSYIKEKASKFNHQYIINDPCVKAYLKKCYIPDVEHLSDTDFKDFSINLDTIQDQVVSDIEKIVVVDGGYQIVTIKDNYPSAQIAFYSVGLLTFSKALLDELDEKETVDPDDVGRLKNLHKFHFTLPVKIIKFKTGSFTETVRKTIFDIFNDNIVFKDDKNTSLLNTVKWLIFEEYHNDLKKGTGTFDLVCPSCRKAVTFKKQGAYSDEINNFHKCSCGEIVYLTDIFQLHDIVDDFNGASGIVSYLMSVFEMVLILTLFRYAHENHRASFLAKYLFIKDGSLALYSKLDDFASKKIRPFIQALHKASLKGKKSYINLVGLEKSGMFIEHLINMETKLADNTLVIPNLNYIKKYITGDTSTVFGERTYFGTKMIYKLDDSLSFVVDFPLPCIDENGKCVSYSKYIVKPKAEDFLNIKTIIKILCDLRCDMYNKSFIPVALINKLVSLSDIPGSKMLTLFTRESIE